MGVDRRGLRALIQLGAPARHKGASRTSVMMVSVLKEKMKRIPTLTKQNVIAKSTGSVSGSTKGFKDFVLRREPEEDDGSFDNKEMLLQIERDYMEAAKRNDVATMTLLGKNVNHNAKNVHDRTALHFAVAGGHRDVVELLVKRKVRVDVADKYGITPLHLGAWFGYADIMRMLVQEGANQKALNQEGMNILHCAAINNHIEVFKYIIDDLQMKDLDAQDKSGKKPFHLAAEHGSAEMVKKMMEEDYQLSTTEKDNEGNTPLHLAAKNGHTEVVKSLLRTLQERNELNEAGESALLLACEGGHEDCAEVLLQAGYDVSIVTKEGRSVLHRVCESGWTSLVKLLINNGADINHQNQNKLAPIHLAVMKGHIPVIHTLIEAGCNIDITDNRKQTALHLAAELGKADVVEMLLKANCDLTLQDKQGKTALGVAARGNYVIIVDMIIKGERYFTWKKDNAIHNDTIGREFPLTFKFDHKTENKQIRGIMWNLAYNQLKDNDWRKLAVEWHFTEPQIQAIEEQWIGPKSYQEHGHRALLIWLHGVQMTNQNAGKELFEGLASIGRKNMAEKIREENAGPEPKKCTIS
ncbi:ankyrin repeat and death domain-containing protein 1A [Erpetoichthys calabaricus]|uniref:Ankyrin repeat and death domain containing 1B n=1 Tax=Erpetoichthys calabaricus TaxID=27687 RepID=A0A8C4T0V3_ERPCA|nr:ankyrin repeat and death domain-containing protein 1A [Erpetoichthys calabaricus]